MHETEDSHFNETHFYAKCFSLWHYNPLKNTTYHRIMSAVAIIYFYEKRLNLRLLLHPNTTTMGLVHLYLNCETGLSPKKAKLGVSWVIDKYINYGQLVLMFSDHDSIATGAWVFSQGVHTSFLIWLKFDLFLFTVIFSWIFISQCKLYL